MIDASFPVVKEDTPTLLSIKEMLENGRFIQPNCYYVSLKGRKHLIALGKDFLIHRCGPIDNPFALHTESELRTLRRFFDYLLDRALILLLERANGSKDGFELTDTLEMFKHRCKPFQKTAPVHRRFKLTVGTSELPFTLRLKAETMFIDGLIVVHMVIRKQASARHLFFVTKLRQEPEIKFNTGGTWFT